YIVFAVVAADYAGSGVERVTITRLFMAGVVPGLLLVVVLYLLARFLPRDMELAKSNAAAHLKKATGTKQGVLANATGNGAAATAVNNSADHGGVLTMEADDAVTADADEIGPRTQRAPMKVIVKAG